MSGHLAQVAAFGKRTSPRLTACQRSKESPPLAPRSSRALQRRISKTRHSLPGRHRSGDAIHRCVRGEPSRLDTDLASTSAARTGARRRSPASRPSTGPRNPVPPSGRELVRREFRFAYPRASRSVAGDQGRPPHPHRRAHGIGQDARRLSWPRSTISCDRVSRRRSRMRRKSSTCRHSRRCRTTSIATSRRHWPASGSNFAGAGFPMSRSAPGSERGIRPSPSASGCVAALRTFW